MLVGESVRDPRLFLGFVSPSAYRMYCAQRSTQRDDRPSLLSLWRPRTLAPVLRSPAGRPFLGFRSPSSRGTSRAYGAWDTLGSMLLTDRARTDPATLAEMEAAVVGHSSLDRVVTWGLAQRPECVVINVVVQDEFTHDVVLRWSEERCLVYDTT